MSIAAGVYRGTLCTNKTAIEGYFKQAYPQIYYVTNYSGGYIEFIVELLNYYCAFLWSFMDLFIVSISICLSTRVQQFNINLWKYKGLVHSHNFSINKTILKKNDFIAYVKYFLD